MRKARLVLLILLAIELQLNAQIFRSNQLGQLLSETEHISESGYCAVVSDNTKELYLDGSLVLVRTISEMNGSTYIIEKSVDQVVTLQYTNGLLIREVSESDGKRTAVVYSYLNGRLAFCSFFENAEESPSQVVFFLRSSDAKEPIAINHNGSLSLITENMLFQNGRAFEILGSDTVIEGDYEINDTGDIVMMEGDTQYTYSSDGLLMLVETPMSRTEYVYEDYVIMEKTTYNSNAYAVESYANGKAYQMESYEDGQLVSLTIYQENGNVQTLYNKGTEIATIFYKPDNRTVDRIEYN